MSNESIKLVTAQRDAAIEFANMQQAALQDASDRIDKAKEQHAEDRRRELTRNAKSCLYRGDLDGAQHNLDAIKAIGKEAEAAQAEAQPMPVINIGMNGMPRNEAELDDSLPGVVIDGLLYQGAKMLIGATAKAGKSHFTMGLARALSKAEKFLKWQTDKPLKVLYIDFELQEPMLRARILKAFNFAVPDSFAYMSLRKFSKFRSPQALDVCLSQNDVSRFDVVVFDCLYKLNDAEDENSNTAMKDVCNWLDQWGGEYDFASIVIHHFGKGQQSNKSIGDRFRGGSALSGDFDAMLSLSAHEEKDHLIVESLVRDFKETAPFVVHWDYPHFIEADLDAHKHADRSGAPKKGTAETMREKLPVGEERAMRYEQLGIDVCEKTFTTRFKEMKRVHKVLKTNSSGKKQNHYYRED